jgi:hypothetical protein
VRGKGRRQHFREPTAHDESRHQDDAREVNIQARVGKIGNIFCEFVNARIRFNTARLVRRRGAESFDWLDELSYQQSANSIWRTAGRAFQAFLARYRNLPFARDSCLFLQYSL